MAVQIMPASDAHVAELARRLRPADRREVVSLGFSDPLDGIRASVTASLWVKAALAESAQGPKLVALWGVGTMPERPGVGGPWMLSTRSMGHHKRDLLRLSWSEVTAMQRAFGLLTGVVDARYRGAVRWMEWLGFVMAPAGTIGGAPFYRFERRG